MLGHEPTCTTIVCVVTWWAKWNLALPSCLTSSTTIMLSFLSCLWMECCLIKLETVAEFYITDVCVMCQAAHVAMMNNPRNCELARFYLRTLNRIQQKNQIRLLVCALKIYQLWLFAHVQWLNWEGWIMGEFRMAKQTSMFCSCRNLPVSYS